MTKDRVEEILSTVSDDFLIDMATTCSNRGIALSAEMRLRKRYPSKLASKSINVTTAKKRAAKKRDGKTKP